MDIEAYDESIVDKCTCKIVSCATYMTRTVCIKQQIVSLYQPSALYCYQLSVIKFIQRAQTSSLNAIGGATRQGASCPCGGGSSMS